MRKLNLPISQVMAILLDLEFKNFVKQLPLKIFCRSLTLPFRFFIVLHYLQVWGLILEIRLQHKNSRRQLQQIPARSLDIILPELSKSSLRRRVIMRRKAFTFKLSLRGAMRRSNPLIIKRLLHFARHDNVLLKRCSKAIS